MRAGSCEKEKRNGGPFHSQGGFTVLELAITVIVIGILVGIAVPVYLGAREKASKATSEYNHRAACGVVDQVWFKLIEQNDNRYRDSLPPASLKAPAPIDAEYMSVVQPKMKWSQVKVTGNHARLGNDGVYKNGEIITPVPGQERFNWENLYGTVGIIINSVWLDGRWQNNTNAVLNYEYLTLITVDRSERVTYTTYHQGVPIESGTFDWDDGWGHPGS
ncbi:MAG: prepilin-type N-terminal cleavage/methylation domain-containing protein [Actinobacteria bacterium]|nr:prepilin-type N-terminal cleavage/methylation domain-containing protein [Actinomycetota bacterium]MBU4218578.1 prepilin-type N-terminal cleavage/methylation domain-containing protein [Actinomycetota bacterium]MCG2818463.1 prepilin-type N-terminal cleavage/methylation domain-containing protein [Actinomycetes bacterium]